MTEIETLTQRIEELTQAVKKLEFRVANLPVTPAQQRYREARDAMDQQAQYDNMFGTSTSA